MKKLERHGPKNTKICLGLNVLSPNRNYAHTII